MEISEKWFAIVNPVSGNGRGLADWPLVNSLLRSHGIIPDYAFTQRKYHAVELAVTAVSRGFRKIIVLGGDGTLHEVVNGLFIQQLVPTTEILIGVVATGTGNDWTRTFGIERKYPEAVRAIAEGYSILQDVGKVSYYKANYKQSRYIVNAAGVGLDAYVIKKITRKKEEGRKGKAMYIWTTLKSVLRYHSTGMKIWIDGKLAVNDLVYSSTIGIGKYNGGGMIQVPHAIADDGLFDLTAIRRISKFRVISRINSLYNGRIYELEQVSHHRGRRVRIESSPESGLEVDGEAVGYSPFEFSIIDRALNVIVSRHYDPAREL